MYNKNIKLLGPGLRTRASQAVPRRKSSWASIVHLCAIIMNTMTNGCPFTKAQPFSPLSTSFIVWAFNVRTQYTNLGLLQIESLQYIYDLEFNQIQTLRFLYSLIYLPQELKNQMGTWRKIGLQLKSNWIWTLRFLYLIIHLAQKLKIRWDMLRKIENLIKFSLSFDFYYIYRYIDYFQCMQ